MRNKLTLGKDDSYEGCFGEYPNCQIERCYHKDECIELIASNLKNILQTSKKTEKTQKTFLIEFESKCRITKPVFIDRNFIQWQQFIKELGKNIEIWNVAEDKLVHAQNIQNDNVIGRYKVNGQNSNNIWELWFDIESNHNASTTSQVNQNFKKLKEATNKVLDCLLSFRIPQEFIYIKSSGRGFHVHVFVEDIRNEKQYQEWMELFIAKTGLPNVKNKEYESLTDTIYGVDNAPSIQIVRKIREFGGINEKLEQLHYCSHVSYSKFKKLKAYPFVFDESKIAYPNINIFTPTKEFLQQIITNKNEQMTEEFKDSTGPINYDLDGALEELFKCPLIVALKEKAIKQHHLINEERVFLSQLFTFFGKKGEQLCHEIIKPCNDYEAGYTQNQIDSVKSRNRKPITCEWAKKRIGCPVCTGSGGKSPIKFAWQPKSLEQLKQVFKKWLCFETITGEEDTEILDVAFAATCDRMIAGYEKCWLFLVARSGGIKTSILRSLGKLSFVYTLDSLTPKTLVSGVVNKHEGRADPVLGIMKDLDKKVLVCKDFTIILTKSSDERNQIFSDLRNAYDGYLDKAFGTSDKKISIHAHFGLLAGSTPVIDNYWQLNQLLGERFLKIRHEINDDKATQKAMENQGQEEEMEHEIQNAVYSFFKGLDPTQTVEISEPIKDVIFGLAKYTAIMRTPLMTMGQDNDKCTFSGEPEYATRLVKQYMRLLRLLCIVRAKSAATLDDALSVARVALDTPPLYRSKVVAFLWEKRSISITDAEHALNCDQYTAERVLNELRHIGVIHDTAEEGAYSHSFTFTSTFDALVNTLAVAFRLLGKHYKTAHTIGSVVVVCDNGNSIGKWNKLLRGLLASYQSTPCDATKCDVQRQPQATLNDNWIEQQGGETKD